MKVVFSLCVLVLLSGCVSAIVPAGPDTYYVSEGPLPITMSAAKAKAECYQTASAWCAQRGLVMVPVSADEQNTVPGRAGSAELTFLALHPGDPRIRPVNLDQPAQIERVENR